MYLYYLLGWRLNSKYLKMFEKGENVDELRVNLKVRNWHGMNDPFRHNFIYPFALLSGATE